MLDAIVTVLVLIGLVVVFGALVLWALAKRARTKLEDELRKRMSGPDPLRDPHETRTLTSLKPGDLVQHDGKDWVVRGSIAYDEDGFTWQEHLLDASGVGGELRRWLTVEEGESGLELVLWERQSGLVLEPAATVELGGTTYRRDESGTAGFTATGTTSTAPTGTMQYVDYVSDGPAVLSFERWSATGSWEISTGRPVSAEQLTVLQR